ncbi:RNA polymerase sigma factor [Hyphococcus luteus]|uniref:RNA polymerase sigma factor n=1 Tax=Hyphococcus luteus TaxID=2058213 RepID=A0A2S7K2D8_9PROT|nr:sigma-70 family RNA polymerase sigma factor [Marinicaulis flavus]PQA86641.1 RNA polymerase sigma factor [Marinicaulis flavus]
MAKNGRKELHAAIVAAERRIWSFFRRRLRSAVDADDLTQEVILRALRAAEQNEIEQPKAFLYGVARNVLLSNATKRSKATLQYIEDLCGGEDFTSGVSLETEIDDRERWREFAEAVNGLPEQCRKVFILKKVYGYSMREISSQLGISPSTVEKHVAASLKRLVKLRMARDASESSLVKWKAVQGGGRNGAPE